MPIPPERFSQRESETQAQGFITDAAAKARDLGQSDLADGLEQLLEQPAAAPSGVNAERHALNQRVEAHMREHGCNFDTALRVVTGEPAKGVDPDRESMNARVEAHMAATGCDISEAIRHVEQEGTA